MSVLRDMSWYFVLVAVMASALIALNVHHAPNRVQVCAYATAANVNGHRVVTQHDYICK
jgi:hypothetical protein